MKKQALILIILIFITLAVAIFLFIGQKDVLLSKDSSLEVCKTLVYKGESAANILFFSSEEQAQRYTDYFLTIEPFKSHKNSFNFYYIPAEAYKPKCELYQEKAVYCYSKELIKKSASCPNDYIIVISDGYESGIRSSAYMNVVSINSRHLPTVFIHEFAHVFANLADEYVPAVLPKKAKNCVRGCEDFPQDGKQIDGCFEGCAKAGYKRSIFNGVMRTLNSENYGLFNEKIISDKILKTPPGPVLSGKAVKGMEEDCLNKEYYLIDGFYNKGKININKKEIKNGCSSEGGSGDFEYALVLNNGSRYGEQDFNPRFVFSDDDEGGEVFEREGEFYLTVPVVKNSKSLRISQNSIKVAEINLENRPCKNE